MTEQANEKPRFANHAEEIAWHLAQRTARPEVECWECGAPVGENGRLCTPCYVRHKS